MPQSLHLAHGMTERSWGMLNTEPVVTVSHLLVRGKGPKFRLASLEAFFFFFHLEVTSPLLAPWAQWHSEEIANQVGF